jgi:hypothetical protein
MRQGGSIASGAGLCAEQCIESQLWLLGPVKRQHVIGRGIYGGKVRVDFYLPGIPLIVESKWQNSKGTADEKFPFLACSILSTYPCKTIVVVGGVGARPGAVNWLRQKLSDSIHEVMSLDQFVAWIIKTKQEANRESIERNIEGAEERRKAYPAGRASQVWDAEAWRKNP